MDGLKRSPRRIRRAKVKYKKPPIRERLLDKVEIITESGCWVWMGGTDTFGYGNPSIDLKKRSAHRLSYAEFNGKIPDGMCVLHRCDVPACINPNHLFLGTHQDNMKDMALKGRARGGGSYEDRNGESNPNSKLTASEALEIKHSRLTQKQLSEKYGVAAGTISGIKTGKRWGSVL